MNRERLLKLADFLAKLHEKDFDFGDAQRCALGWTPEVFPTLVVREFGLIRLRDEDVAFDYIRTAMKLFGISCHAADALFTPNIENWPELGRPLSADTRPKSVARRIRKYVEVYG